MGADFLYAVLPFCYMTEDREKELKGVVDALGQPALEELADIFLGGTDDEHDHEDMRQILHRYVKEYGELAELRTTAVFQLEGSIPVLLSGGMSWGDAPTEAFSIMSCLETVEEVWSLLWKWSKEDLASEKGAEDPLETDPPKAEDEE